MKIPKSFRIKGQWWDVQYKWRLTHENEPVLGLCDKAARVIYLDRLTAKEEKPAVFMHELVHAIIAESHLNEDGGINETHEGVLAESIATVMMDLFNLKWKRANHA